MLKLSDLIDPGGRVEVEAEQRLSLLERRVAAQRAALARVPMGAPVPPSVLALLATPLPRELEGGELPPRCLPRLSTLMCQLQDMIDELTLREQELASRLATVRAARRPAFARHLLDCQS
jgi:hypothetical protein